jgi:hypothetical protein
MLGEDPIWITLPRIRTVNAPSTNVANEPEMVMTGMKKDLPFASGSIAFGGYARSFIGPFIDACKVMALPLMMSLSKQGKCWDLFV